MEPELRKGVSDYFDLVTYTTGNSITKLSVVSHFEKFEPHSHIENIRLTDKFYVNFYVPMILCGSKIILEWIYFKLRHYQTFHHGFFCDAVSASGVSIGN